MADKPKMPTVTLEKPIKRGETEIAELGLRKPSAGELRGLSVMDVVRLETTALLTLIPRISVPPLVDHEAATLEPADLLAIGAEIADFFMTSADRAKFPTT